MNTTAETKSRATILSAKPGEGLRLAVQIALASFWDVSKRTPGVPLGDTCVLVLDTATVVGKLVADHLHYAPTAPRVDQERVRRAAAPGTSTLVGVVLPSVEVFGLFALTGAPPEVLDPVARFLLLGTRPEALHALYLTDALNMFCVTADLPADPAIHVVRSGPSAPPPN